MVAASFGFVARTPVVPFLGRRKRRTLLLERIDLATPRTMTPRGGEARMGGAGPNDNPKPAGSGKNL